MSEAKQRVEIKICGLRRPEDAARALDLGADYLGFVLYPRSPRCVDAATLKALVAGLPAAARCVGVFVNAPPAEVARVVGECRLWAAQVHGDEAAGDFAAASYRVWRAVHVGADGVRPCPRDWPFAERFVIDAAPAGVYGGSGKTCDWTAAAVVAARCRAMLAGGITPENVVDGLRAVRPAGVDVSSGVEAAPGVKDWPRLEALIRAVRGFDERT